MERIAVLGVPTSAGAYGVGPEHAPAALRDAGLVPDLTEAGATVVDVGDLPVSQFRPDARNPRRQSIGSVVRVASQVRDRVAAILGDGDLPLVLGGDCTVTLGVVAAMTRAGEEFGVVYLDGDLDASTPETTESGILDAMGVAHMLSIPGADQDLASLAGVPPLLRGPDLAIVGYDNRSAGGRRAKILRERGVHLFADSMLARLPEGTARAAVDAVAASSRIVLHFDVDVIDSVEVPLAQYPHFNSGVPLSVAGRFLEAVCSMADVAAVVLTEVNPANDPQGVYLPRLVERLVRALGPGVQ